MDENPTNGRIALGLSVIVRVTIRDGTFHEDIGYGTVENVKGKGAAFEKAKKEGSTDALKRALRNFGNVLGNCLYDKDYLTKIQKVKVQPTRWDTERLHRHADFAPVKQEGERKSAVADGQNGNQQSRLPSNQSGNSFGSAEFEEDFGSNAFDETDFSHPDEVRLDPSTMETPAKGPMPRPAQSGGQGKQGVPRVQSMPQMRPPNLQSPAPLQNPQPPQRVQAPQRPPDSVGNVPQQRMPPPQQQGRPNTALQAPNNQDPQENSSSTTTADGSPVAHAAPRMPPTGIPEGFVTGRSAELLNLPPGARPPNAALPFNPHAEATSIRRTHGLNPGKSAPVTRSSVQQTGSATVLQQDQQQQPPRPQSPAMVNGPANAQTGALPPGRTNFVNPSADAHRRIGMPPPPGGMQNRGAYRPPSVVGGGAAPTAGVKRPALTDVSNLQLQQLDGTSDVKKPKIDEEPKANELITCADDPSDAAAQ